MRLTEVLWGRAIENQGKWADEAKKEMKRMSEQIEKEREHQEEIREERKFFWIRTYSIARLILLATIYLSGSMLISEHFVSLITTERSLPIVGHIIGLSLGLWLAFHTWLRRDVDRIEGEL